MNLLPIASLAALVATTPTAAGTPPAPIYTASYDAAHDRYCVQAVSRRDAAPLAAAVGNPCHSEEQWRNWGLTFSRKATAGGAGDRGGSAMR